MAIDVADVGSHRLPLPASREILAKFARTEEVSARPGFSSGRIIRLIERAIAGTGLDLSGLHVLTEAATGVYAVTPVIAAMAGAKRIRAVTRASRYGSVDDVVHSTMTLAAAAGVSDRIEITEGLRWETLDAVDIVTNSGHLRPLTREMIGRLPASAVVALMYEAWEFRGDDLDLAACADRGVPVVGVNERDPSVDVFSYLGELCARHMQNAGVSVRHSRIALLCDNDFGEPIRATLQGLGGLVSLIPSVQRLPASDWDAIVIALRPEGAPRIGEAEVEHLSRAAPETAAIVQFWGDLDRRAADARGLNVWPPAPPAPGHMAALLSELGPEPIIRLQTGGLRAAECVRRGRPTDIAQVLETANRSVAET
jgi:hypothetical protein